MREETKMTRDELEKGWPSWPVERYRVRAPDGRETVMPYKRATDGRLYPDWPNLTDEQCSIMWARAEHREREGKGLTGVEYERMLADKAGKGIEWARLEFIELRARAEARVEAAAMARAEREALARAERESESEK